MEEPKEEMETDGSKVNDKESRLGLCEVCSWSAAKYTCPRCEVKTCSLKCNKIHKLELECDGTRDKTKFIPLKKMTNLDLSSDYRMLEELTRNVEVYKKTLTRKFFNTNKELPHHLYKLRLQAATYKTIIRFLPSCFVKRKENTTYLHFKTNVIHWHIEWIFVNADNLKMVDKKVPETEKLCSILHKYFVKQEDAVVQEKLQYYQACDVTGIKIFLKAEECAGNKYYELDPVETLKESFKNKTVIEYPTLYIVLKEHATMFTLIDEEESMKASSIGSSNIVDNIIKNAETDDSLYSSLKNLLFISEYSDGELSDEGHDGL